MAKAKIFKTKNGKPTDILHSYNYYKAPYSSRRASAFDKDFLSKLSNRDKLLMRGYAQAKIEDMQAFTYRNPIYVRKGSRKNYKTI